MRGWCSRPDLAVHVSRPKVKEDAVFVNRSLPLSESPGRGVNRCVSGQSAERVIKWTTPARATWGSHIVIVLFVCCQVAKWKNNNNYNNIYIPNFLAVMIFSIFLFVLSLVSKLFNLDWQRLIFSVKRNKMTMSSVFVRPLVLVPAWRLIKTTSHTDECIGVYPTA